MDQLIGGLLLLIGPCALIYAVVATRRTTDFLRRSTETSGEVIRLERSRGTGRGSRGYAPVFSFTAADGKTFTVTSDVASSPPAFAAGDHVRVRYDPTDPINARIHTFFQTWGQAVILAFVGAVFIVVGLVFVQSH